MCFYFWAFSLVCGNNSSCPRNHNPSADCGSDHQLFMTNINAAIKKVKQIHFGKLQDDVTKREFFTAVDKEWQEMLSHSTDDVEVFWKGFKVAIQETAKEVLGFKTGQECREWLSDATLELMTVQFSSPNINVVLSAKHFRTREDYTEAEEKSIHIRPITIIIFAAWLRKVPQKIKRNMSKEYAKMWRLLRYRMRTELSMNSFERLPGSMHRKSSLLKTNKAKYYQILLQ